MIVSEKIENNIKYTFIKYNSNPTTEELIEALDIIHNSKYCKVFLWYDGIQNLDFIYYKNGKIHNEFDFAIHLGARRFYGVDGEIEQTYENFNKEYYKKLLRYKKLINLKK